MSSYRRVEVLPHDPTFATRAREEAARIERALGAVHVAIHHIGSTAIAIPAKPVLDLLLVVTDVTLLDAPEPRLAMETLGFEARGEFGIAGRRFFVKGTADGQRTHHVHAFGVGAPEITRHLDFRDYLRAHPEEAAEYGALKTALAAQHPADIEAYMDGKDAFIKEIERRAVVWRDASKRA